MIKRLIRYSLLSLLVVLACETERTIFKGPYFIRFTDESITYKESHSHPVDIEIHVGGPAPTEDIVVAYQITGDAREGIDFKILGETEDGRMTIKAGAYTGIIQVQLINNSNNILRSQDIIFTLATVSSGSYQIGQGESGIGKSFTFTIQDDCVLGGDYIGVQNSSTDNVTVTSTDCENYLLSNWNINVFTTSTVMDLKFIDNGDNTITIPDQEEETLPADLASIRGTGVVDPETRIIILTITLLDFEDQPIVTITLNPN